MNKLKIEHVSKSYGKNLALDDINLSIEDGIIGLLGRNGAGKSTLINILIKIIDKDKGEIFYNGENINDLEYAYNDIIGYMPQQLSLDLELSVSGFLKYMQAMKRVKNIDLDEILYSINLYDNRDKKVKNLSGGMKQRLLIGQVLLNSPKIIFLDEPTAGLDPFERMNLRNIIYDISKDRIIILTTHVISDVEYIANKLVFLKNGRIKDEESQEYFTKNIDVYESFEDEKLLKKRDPNLYIVNRTRTEKGVNIRYISKKSFENKVTTSLDDIYLGVLND